MSASASGKEILFLAHRLPFPPDRGDKIHSHHVLKALTALAPVHVACFADDAGDWAHEGELAACAATYCLRARKKPLPLAGLEALAKGQPISLTAFHDRHLADYVRSTLASGRIGTIFVFSGQMGQYVPADFTGRVILDLVDVDSAKFDAYGREGKGPMRWVHAREGRLLAVEEGRLAARADHTLLISKAEAALLKRRLPANSPAHVGVLSNGIDCSFFSPEVAPDAALAAQPGPKLIFTGQMDYAPNIAAVTRAAQQLMPAILKHHPQASFHIVGRAPTPAVQALHGVNGTQVHGAVPDMRPYLAAADMALVPLEIARGVQNKVLEAMAMALPCVLSPGAATGIEARDGTDYAIADSDQALIATTLALLDNPDHAKAMGQAARVHVLAHASWQAALAPLAGLIGATLHGA
ncbi:TIGR03087 family PEP-CTERM/XrtA system glycosyltransferase [Novosphingobium terrae]|uniref:TIGR03087 family PEP-CTERM/XrtA system glycosyltransferase n=1 Tax=Novosphingobium terrae TaxID=2726189 RepID=UPI00197E95E2|nr:TIGR03087 family PEP-CTERM/XrtA system glycosyltransferase [Novosphingobium terrae]